MWQTAMLHLLGGMGLLLYGMYIMSEGLKKIAGDKLRTILSTLTNNRLIGLLVGVIITVIFQSSTATSVVLVGLTNASIISLQQTFSVILGAGIGTSITAQLLALKVTEAALPIIGLGSLIILFSRRQRYKRIGQALIGFGLLFLGLKVMADTMAPLRNDPFFVDGLMSISNRPLLAITFAALFTFLVHSSAATIGIVMVLSIHGLVPLTSAVYLIFGANIGTTFTAVLSSIGSTKESQRVAAAHFLFRFISVLLLLPFVEPFADLINWLTPHSPGFQVANINTAFNIGTALIFLPITSQFARVLEWLIPEKEHQAEGVKPKYLDESLISTPTLAIGMVQKEIIRISDRAIYIVMHCDKLFKNFETDTVELVLKQEDEIDLLSIATNNYLTNLMRQPLSSDDFNRCLNYINIVSDYEHIGDVVEKNIVYLAESKHANLNDFSADGYREITHMHRKLIEMLHCVNTALLTGNISLAEKAKLLHEDIVEFEFRSRISHFSRMQKGNKEIENTGSIFLDLIDSYLRIAEHLNNISSALTNKVACSYWQSHK